MKRSIWKWILQLAVLAILGLLVWWVLRNAPLVEIWAALRQLRLWQIAVILVVNGLLYVLVTLRWWLIVRAEARQVPYLALIAVRLAVFGVSYFTLGPQVGGEPLQVLALQRRYGLSYTRATASVLMDKLIEFLVDFLLLPFGLIAIFRAGALAGNSLSFPWELTGLLVLMLWPPIHIYLLHQNHHPLTALLHALPFIPKKSRTVRFLRAAEWLAGNFCQRHLSSLLEALGVTLVAGAGMVAEYALMASFLGIHLAFWKSVAGWATGWLSLLMPLPGGLGAMEAGQVLVLGRFGISAALAISMALVIRSRDIVLGATGLLLAGTSSWKKQQ